jgi:hypothetical protein
LAPSSLSALDATEIEVELTTPVTEGDEGTDFREDEGVGTFPVAAAECEACDVDKAGTDLTLAADVTGGKVLLVTDVAGGAALEAGVAVEETLAADGGRDATSI